MDDDRAWRLERLIGEPDSRRAGLGELPLSLPEAPAEVPDAELRELAALAVALTDLGRKASVVDPSPGWARLKPLLLATPQDHRLRLNFRWLSFGRGAFGAPALVRVSASAFALFLLLFGGALLLLPRENASAAFARDLQQLSQTAAAIADGDRLSNDDRAMVDRQARIVLSRAVAADSVVGLRREETQRNLAQLNAIRTRLVVLLSDDPVDASVLASLNTVSGLLQSALGTPVDGTNPPSAAIATVPTTAPATSASPSPVSTVARPDEPIPNAGQPTPSSDSGRTRVPSSEPSRVAPLASVQRVCSRVLDRTTLADCSEAAAAATVSCSLLPGNAAQECARAAGSALTAAQQRLQRLSASCQRLPTTRTQHACTEVTERGHATGDRARGREQDDNRGN